MKGYSQGFPNTDSLRTYNIKYITNNAATAFTNLRLHTLLRGIIDHLDSTGAGGGSIGIDTLYALNDSTIRYRRNGAYRNVVLKGVYDMRRKVDTAYALNDTTLQIKINGVNRNIILPGRGSITYANATGAGDTLLTASNTIKRIDTDNTLIRSTNGNKILIGADTISWLASIPRLTDTARALRTLIGASNAITELTGPITAIGPGIAATSITNNSIEKSKLEQSPGLSVIGNIGNTTDDVGNITAANDGNILRRFGTSIGFGTINLASTNAVGSSILPVLNGGTGTAFPGLVQGTNITITGTWPNQTINSSGGGGNLDATLALAGRLSANRSVSMAHRRWDLDSAALRLRSVDSAALSIDMAKAGDIFRFNKPEGVARTYPGSTPFKFIMENSTDDEPTERNNPVKWGWNINRADSSNYSGVWWSMEPNYRPGGTKFKELIYEVSLPNGIIKNSRLLMSTFVERDSLGNSDNTWDFRGTNINAYNLENTVGYWSVSRGSMNIHITTAGSTDFSITNGSDAALFTMSPSTSILDYTGAKLRVNGSINFSLKNGTSTERELISFEGDGGTTGYMGKYNSAWAAQTHLQNGMLIMAANGVPTETMLLLKPGGTAWLGDLDSYNSGTQKVNISGSLALRGIGKVTTAPEILVRTSDSTIRAMDTAAFRTMMGIGGLSSAITSINSMTGPAISITAGTGISTSSASNDVTISVDVNNSVLPHTIDKQFIDANNTGTSETDLYTKSIAGGTLGSNGQSLSFEVGGVFNDATATANLQLYFAGTAFGGTGAMTISGTGAWRAQGSIVRVSSSVYRASVTFFSDNTTQKIFTSMANVTSVDFTTSNTFKITGTAGGGGGGSNDITAQMWIITYNP